MLSWLATWRAQDMDPEAAHGLALRTVALAGGPLDFNDTKKLIKQLGARLIVPDQRERHGVRRKYFGRNLPSLVGLAGGADKNGVAIAGWPRVGFGFAEVGTNTFHRRDGNPGPRIWRYRDQQALANFMGLPNEGFEVLRDNLKAFRAGETGPETERFCIGVSLSLQEGDTLDELAAMATALAPYVDYFTLNVSCPNVPSHSSLDAVEALGQQIDQLQTIKSASRPKLTSPTRPVLVKLGPTRDQASLDATVRALKTMGADGFVVTNTVGYDNRALLSEQDQPLGWAKGGYSGPALVEIGTDMVRTIRKAVPGALIIGVGGIQSPADALAYRDAGADLVQLYTGLTYQGPPLIRHINRALRRPLAKPAR